MRAVFGRGVWRAIAIGLVVVAGCEAASRVAEPYAGVPFGVGVLAKQPRLDYLASRGECRDIVFFGSSQVAWGLRPDVVRTLTGRSAYNAGLLAAGPSAIEPWLIERVVPALAPSTVVLAVEETAFYPAAAEESDPVRLELETLNATVDRAGVWTFPSRASEWVRSHSALIRLRPQLQHPDTAWRVVLRTRNRSRGLATEQLFDAEGWVDAEKLTLDDIKVEGRPALGFPQGGVRGREVAGFADIREAVVELQARGVGVALVVLPLNSSVRTGVFRQNLPEIREFANELGVGFVNLFALSGRKDLFFNEDHLNARGAQLATEQLVNQLRDEGLIPSAGC